MTHFSHLALPLITLASCSLEREPLAPESAMKVLFIGSSLIDAHDLPVTVRFLADSRLVSPCYCISIAYQDYELDDHYATGDALRALESVAWDFVVL